MAVCQALMNSTTSPEVKDAIRQVSTAEQTIIRIEQQINDDKDILTEGTKLADNISRAGSELVSTTNRIQIEVDKALLKTEPDFKDLSDILKNLSPNFTKFTTVPTGEDKTKAPETSGDKGPSLATAGRPEMEPPGAKELKDAAEKLQETVSVLKDAATDMDAAAREVALIVNQVGKETPVEALKRCGIPEDRLPAPGVVVNPDTLEFTAGTPTTQIIELSGGKGDNPRYYAKLLGDGVSGLSVEQPEAFGATVLVRITADTKEGKYQVYITDGAQHGKIVLGSVGDCRCSRSRVSHHCC